MAVINEMFYESESSMNQGRRMPPKLANKVKKLNLIVPDDLAEEIDDWRSHQPGIPNVSAAIRQLIKLGLKASNANHDKPKAAKKSKG